MCLLGNLPLCVPCRSTHGSGCEGLEFAKRIAHTIQSGAGRCMPLDLSWLAVHIVACSDMAKLCATYKAVACYVSECNAASYVEHKDVLHVLQTTLCESQTLTEGYQR